MSSGLDASVTFGLIEATAVGDLSLNGLLEVAYCTDCGDTYADGFDRLSETSSFYVQNVAGYSLSGGGEFDLIAILACTSTTCL